MKSYCIQAIESTVNKRFGHYVVTDADEYGKHIAYRGEILAVVNYNPAYFKTYKTGESLHRHTSELLIGLLENYGYINEGEM